LHVPETTSNQMTKRSWNWKTSSINKPYDWKTSSINKPYNKAAEGQAEALATSVGTRESRVTRIGNDLPERATSQVTEVTERCKRSNEPYKESS
jgi:hypothetical protein